MHLEINVRFPLYKAISNIGSKYSWDRASSVTIGMWYKIFSTLSHLWDSSEVCFCTFPIILRSLFLPWIVAIKIELSLPSFHFYYYLSTSLTVFFEHLLVPDILWYQTNENNFLWEISMPLFLRTASFINNYILKCDYFLVRWLKEEHFQ